MINYAVAMAREKRGVRRALRMKIDMVLGKF
jgi:hypothetical protein